MLNVGGVVESMGTVVKRSLSLSRCWSKVERVSVLSADLDSLSGADRIATNEISQIE